MNKMEFFKEQPGMKEKRTVYQNNAEKKEIINRIIEKFKVLIVKKNSLQ